MNNEEGSNGRPEKALSNARNARHSTGPATAEGRATSSKNSTRHGILAISPIINGEKAKEWQAFLDGLREALLPVGVMEEALVMRIALALWRHGRLIRWEVEAMDRFSNDATRRSSFSSQRDMLPYHDVLETIARYESHLGRQYRADLHELQRLQAGRLGLPVPVPAVVDATLEMVARSEVERREQ